MLLLVTCLKWHSLQSSSNHLSLIIKVLQLSGTHQKKEKKRKQKNEDLFSFYGLQIPRRNACRNQMGLTTRNEEWKSHLLRLHWSKFAAFDGFNFFFFTDWYMECAKAIEGGNWDVADSLLEEIRSPAPKEESISTRKVVN